MSRSFVFTFSLMLASVAAAQGVQEPVATSCTVKIWMGREAEFEEFLKTADVVSVEKIGVGVTDPSRVVLRKGEQEFRAAFKPIKRGRASGYWESFEAEVSAYELDKVLGLNMVPPTIAREIDGQKGSLQLWVENCKLYEEVKDQVPLTVSWSNQLSRMKTFDSLILNSDRNARNFLVDPEHDIILIDHSRAFLTDKKIGPVAILPYQYDRQLMERLKVMNKNQLEGIFDGVLMGGQIDAILARRDMLVEHVEKMIAEKGEQNVLFDATTQ